MRILPIYFSLGSALFFSPLAEAGRPLNTDDSGTVPIKTLETELAYQYVDNPDDEHNLGAVLTTGLAKGLDVGIEFPYQFLDVDNGDDVDGWSDIAITTKWNFFAGEDAEATLSINYKTESGEDDKGLGTGEPEYTILGILSTAVGKKGSVHFNLGPTIVKEGDDVLNYLAAFEWPVNETITLLTEIYGSTNFEEDFEDQPLSGQIGITHSVTDSAVFDVGVSFGVSDADPNVTITTGLTIEFAG